MVLRYVRFRAYMAHWRRICQMPGPDSRPNTRSREQRNSVRQMFDRRLARGEWNVDDLEELRCNAALAWTATNN